MSDVTSQIKHHHPPTQRRNTSNISKYVKYLQTRQISPPWQHVWCHISCDNSCDISCDNSDTWPMLHVWDMLSWWSSDMVSWWRYLTCFMTCDVIYLHHDTTCSHGGDIWHIWRVSWHEMSNISTMTPRVRVMKHIKHHMSWDTSNVSHETRHISKKNVSHVVKKKCREMWRVSCETFDVSYDMWCVMTWDVSCHMTHEMWVVTWHVVISCHNSITTCLMSHLMCHIACHNSSQVIFQKNITSCTGVNIVECFKSQIYPPPPFFLWKQAETVECQEGHGHLAPKRALALRDRFMSHTWMRHVARMHAWYICEWVVSYMWICMLQCVAACCSVLQCVAVRRGTYVNESCHTCEWGRSHVWMRRVTHMNESCHKWMSHVTHMNESCHTYEW